MNTLKIAILLILAAACQMLVAGDTTPINWKQVKALGRANSNYLKAKANGAKTTDAVPNPDLAHFQRTIRHVLNKKCVACHGPQESHANLRVDKLNPDLLTGPDVGRWREIYKVLSNSEMPPKDEPDFELADADRSNIVEWLGNELKKASLIRRNSSEHSSFRRMTKYEYEYALQDLLGLPYSLAKTLPPETASEDGFKNHSEMLQMSAMQFESYREIGLKALQRAIVRGEPPAGSHLHHLDAGRDG